MPVERTHHGDTVVDPYAWLAVKDDPDTVAYLTAENAYTQTRTEHLAPLREAVFSEIKTRTQETDVQLPQRKGGYWYYARTVEGQQYGIHCRRKVAEGETTPPISLDGSPLPDEEILLDGNVEAGDSPFFDLGTLDVSPDGRLLAYSVDFTGDERFTLKVRDLATGANLPDEVTNVYHGSAWSGMARRCSISGSTTHGGRTRCGGTRSAPPPPPRTPWSTRSPMSGSPWASA